MQVSDFGKFLQTPSWQSRNMILLITSLCARHSPRTKHCLSLQTVFCPSLRMKQGKNTRVGRELKFKLEKKLLSSVLLQTYFKIGLLFTNYLKLDIFKSYYMPHFGFLTKKKTSNINN